MFKKFGQFSFTPRLKKIDLLIQREEFDKALEAIKSLEGNERLSNINQLRTQILKIHGLIGTDDPESGLDLANNLLETSKKLNEVLYIENLLVKALALFELGKFDESLDVLNEGDGPLESLSKAKQDEKKASIVLLKGRNFRKKREKELALEYMNESIDLSKNLNEVAVSNNEIGIIYASKGEFDDALKYFLSSLNAYKEVDRTEPTIRIHNNIGLVYSYKGDQDTALIHYQKSLDLSEEFKNQLLSATLTYNIGLIYLNRGELDSALDYTQKSLKVYEELGGDNEIAQCHNNIGNIHHQKGNLDQALEYYQKSLEMFEKLDSPPDTAMSFNNIGNIHQLKGDTAEATSYYEKSLELLEEIGNNLDTSLILQNLIQMLTSYGDIEESKKYFERLKEISEKEKDNNIIIQAYNLAKAIQLKISDRVIKRAEAQQLFQQIAEEEIVQHEYTVMALYNLCDLLIRELRTSGDEEVLNEIKEIIKRLLNIGESQQMPRLLTNVYRLQSKMALLDSDLDLARKSLAQAQQIASEKGLENISVVISGEYDSLLVQLGKWTDLIDQNASMMERLDLTELEGMVSQIIRQEEEIPRFTEEEPALILILSKSGVQYSRQLTSEKGLDDQIIGDLITAINSFVQETFATTGSIERIKHKEHTCVLRQVQSIDSTLLCCYVFKGQSYSALQKLEKFIKVAEDKESVLEVLSTLSKDKPIPERNPLDNLISKVFISA